MPVAESMIRVERTPTKFTITCSKPFYFLKQSGILLAVHKKKGCLLTPERNHSGTLLNSKGRLKRIFYNLNEFSLLESICLNNR